MPAASTSTRVQPRTVPLPSLRPEDHPEAVFADNRRTTGVLLAVTGLAGVGKSTWTRQFADAARRHRVVAVTADAFEQGFPSAFADKLAHAAGSRLGVLGEPGTPDLLGVARVLLSVLARGVSSARRLVLIIDNAQWIDDASVAALRFVLARVAHGGVTVVLSGHEPRTSAIAQTIVSADPGAWEAVRAIRLEPLDAPALREYASRVHDVEVSLRLAGRIRELSGGLPVLVDAVVATMERPAEARRAHWDEDVRFPHLPQNPFSGAAAGLPPSLMAAVEIASVLRDAVSAAELAAVADALGEEADPDAALDAGLLVSAGEATVVPFHDLYAADVRAHLSDARRAAILVAASGVLGNIHRAFICRLDAARRLDSDLLAQVHRMVADAVAEQHPDRAIDYLRRAAALADPTTHDDLIVEACILAAAMLVSPSVIDLLPELERMPSSPVRDLALLQTRQITGDISWAASFAAALLAEEIDHPDARTIRLHVSMMAVMIQLTTDDYGPLLDLLDRTRAIAAEIADHPEAIADRRLQPLPAAQEVALRATGLAVVASARLGLAERIDAELAALSEAIATADDSPALADALTCRAGVLAGVGVVDAAAADLERSIALASAGAGGWSLGHARVLLAYCSWVLGDRAAATAALREAAVTVLDSIDVSSRPLVYLLRGVLDATGGDEAGYAAALRTARDVTVTDYDTFGVELELLAAVEHARAAGRPDDVLSALSAEAIGDRWLAGSSIFSYRVDALSALGRAEEADRELARLRTLAGAGWSPIYGSLDWLEGRVAEAYGLTERALQSYRRASADGFPGPRAQALADAGRLALTTGDRHTAERLLRAAAEGFRRLGARPARRRCLALLDGDAQPVPGVAELESLSSREREVATLAERGLTNAEIAESLYLSAPTVAFHMRNILAKLGLRSRRELRGILRASP